jgi:hypothetical protein
VRRDDELVRRRERAREQPLGVAVERQRRRGGGLQARRCAERVGEPRGARLVAQDLHDDDARDPAQHLAERCPTVARVERHADLRAVGGPARETIEGGQGEIVEHRAGAGR